MKLEELSLRLQGVLIKMSQGTESRVEGQEVAEHREDWVSFSQFPISNEAQQDIYQAIRLRFGMYEAPVDLEARFGEDHVWELRTRDNSRGYVFVFGSSNDVFFDCEVQMLASQVKYGQDKDISGYFYSNPRNHATAQAGFAWRTREI